MGATVDRTRRCSRGASCKCVSRRKCILRRLLAILRFAHDRPMLQIGPGPRSCGSESWSRTHAAANREFDGDARCRAALWLPTGGAGGRPFFPGYLRIMARRMAALWLLYGCAAWATRAQHGSLVAIIDAYRDKTPPSSPRGEPEGGHACSFVAIIDAYRGKRAALQLPHDGGARERAGSMVVVKFAIFRGVRSRP